MNPINEYRQLKRNINDHVASGSTHSGRARPLVNRYGYFRERQPVLASHLETAITPVVAYTMLLDSLRLAQGMIDHPHATTRNYLHAENELRNSVEYLRKAQPVLHNGPGAFIQRITAMRDLLKIKRAQFLRK
jgi:hypothetical protein